MPPWNEKFNAGVWCVKNSSLTQNILTEWFSYYDKNAWEKKDNIWECQNCVWAGEKYEQGSFIENILNKYKDNIEETNYKILNNHIYCRDYDCINHFAGDYKKDIDSI